MRNATSNLGPELPSPFLLLYSVSFSQLSSFAISICSLVLELAVLCLSLEEASINNDLTDQEKKTFFFWREINREV